MPEYGLLGPDEGRGLLPWSWARRRLARSRRYWLATTRPDRRPHAVAVWGVWLDDVFWYFSTGRRSRKARNLTRNPSCAVTTERADKAIIVEGSAKRMSDPSRLRRVASRYLEKYGEEYPSDSSVYAVRPVKAFGFIEAEADFTGTATRWRFDEERPRRRSAG